MIPKPDSQSYTRFLTTVGLFLCVVGVLAPALILRETAVLRMPATELARLTPVGRKEMERRQRVSRHVGLAAPYVGGGLLMFGLGLVAMALPRLRKQEGVSDQLSAAELKNALAPQDPIARAAQLAEDVQRQVESLTEPAESEQSGAVVDEPEDHDPPARSAEPATPGSREALGGDEVVRDEARPAQERYADIARQLEQRVLDRLLEVKPPGYEVRSHVRLSGPPDLAIDILLFTEIDQLPDIVVAVKVFAVPGVYPEISAFVSGGAYALEQYRERTRRRAIAWLIVVAAEPQNIVMPSLSEDRRGDLLMRVVSADAIETLDLPRRLSIAKEAE